MANVRATVLAALAATPPDVEAARQLLLGVDERDLTVDALTLRNAIIEAANWIENGKARAYEIATFLRDAADGRLPELDDHDIDLDVPDDGPSSGLVLPGVPFAPRPGTSPLPGPDAMLLKAMQARDALVARRIAGDTPSDFDISSYQDALVALGRALAPLVDADDRDAATGAL